MEDIENIQLPETAQSQDVRSESIIQEDSTNNSDLLLASESPTTSLNDKTDDERLVQNSDNLLNVNLNSPKTTLLGKLKAKQRLQAFLLPKQTPYLSSPIKKNDEIPIKNDKNIKKPKQSPMEKAKSIIEELEEIKKVEIQKIISPTLFKERRVSFREKHYRKKSRSKSVELVRKISEKGKYPDSWEEIKNRQLSLTDLYEIKLNKSSKNSKNQEGCHDFRKQLLFELPAQPLVSLKVKGVTGQDKTIPSQHIRFTRKSPSISYSVNHQKYRENYLLASEIYNFIPKSHADILKRLKTDKKQRLPDESPSKTARKWYPKQPLNNITEGCELLETSLGLSILQNYMNEEDEEEDKYDASVSQPVPDIVENEEVEEQSTIEDELNVKMHVTSEDIKENEDKVIEKEEIEAENEKPAVEITSKVKKSKEKNHKHKRDKNEKKESRKRKRKKENQQQKESKKNKIKSDKKAGNSEQKKDGKSKKREKEVGKLDKKVDGEDKKKHSKKEKKKDTEVKSVDKIESKIEIKKDTPEEDDKKETKKCTKEIKEEIKKSTKEIKDETKKSTKEIKDETKKSTKEIKEEPKKTDKKKSKKTDDKTDKKQETKDPNKSKGIALDTAQVQLYYDEFESTRYSSPSTVKIENIKKETQKPHDSSRESKKKDIVKKEHKHESKSERSNAPNVPKSDKKPHSSAKHKNCAKVKDENLFKIEPLKPEEELGTPNTEEYHSHWESDEDVTNVISYSPLLPQKLDTSWESDEELLRADKTQIHTNRYSEQQFPRRSRDRSSERRSKKFLEGERSLEMPLNIVNLTRKDSRRSGKAMDFPDRKFLNNDMRLLYNEDSWERGEYLKIFNDIEGEKLMNERKTLSEERRLLELEKRRLAEKLEKRSFNCNIFDDFSEDIAEKIHTGDENYLKSTDYINETRVKKKYERESRKRSHSIEDHKNSARYEEDRKKYKQSEPKKRKHDKIQNYDVKGGNYKDFVKIESKDDYERYDGAELFLCKEDSKKLTVTVPDAKSSKRKGDDAWQKIEKPEPEYKIESDCLQTSDISESLNSTCDSLLTKVTNRSDFLENEYEEFLKVVTSDIPNAEEIPKEKKSIPKKKKKKKKVEVEKVKKPKRKRKYSTSSSSSSSSDSDSSSSSSSSSSDSSSSSSSSSYERKKKRRKVKAKQKKMKDKHKKQEVMKIEMTHSIVKDLDDLQPFPIAKTPIIQIKEELEDPGYSVIPTVVPPVVKEKDIVVPLPVPSPAIVPPPLLNVLPIKQEKPDINSVTTKADSTTSIVHRIPLIPTKFIPSMPRVETAITTAACPTNKVEVQKVKEVDPIIESFKDQSSNKVEILNVQDNDSSHDFTEYFAKKTEKDQEILSAKIKENETVIPASPNIVKVDPKISSPIRKLSPIRQRSASPKRRRRSISPRDKRFFTPDNSRRSPRRSVSPKYRNSSPRRSISPRRRPRELSPPRRNLRYREDSTARRKSPMERYDRRRKSPSPKNRRSHPPRSRRSVSPKNRRSPSPRGNRRSPSPRGKRRSPSPRGNRRSPSPRSRRSISPRNYISSFRNRSPNRRSLSPKNRRRSYSRSVSLERKKEPIQQTLQRLAGVDEHYYQSATKSPINSPVERFKRSVADSTISDDQLLLQNSTESADSPAYRAPSLRLLQSPASPKRVPLDIRINQVLGLDKNSPKPITTTYAQNYNYEQYTEQYQHYQQYGQNVRPRENYIQPPPPPLPKPQNQMGTSKVLQIGNVLQVVPTEEIPPPAEIPKPPQPSQKIVQVGNMLQIVPTPTPHIPKVAIVPPPITAPPKVVAQADVSLNLLQSTLAAIKPPPPPVSVVHNTPTTTTTTTTHEKISPEELMLQKIAERRAERAKRHEDREKKRNEKEKRRKEKEKKKQLRLKIKSESMIKKALQIETEALAMGDAADDNEDGLTDSAPSCWPAVSLISNTPLKPAGKGILITHGFSKLNIEDENDMKKLKCVKFADGVVPGEGTSPSAGEELSSPPPPKEKRFKKIKKKKLLKKKKIKVKIIRKSSADSPDDEDLDSLPPPSPPPGSPPSHVFPARIKVHTINNIHPSYAAGVPLMTVSNYLPQFRPNIPMSVPPPIHNVPHGGHHAARASNTGVVPSMHGVPHGMPPHPHGPPPHPHGQLHHPAGPRL